MGYRIWGGLFPKAARPQPVCRSAAPERAYPHTSASTACVQCTESSGHEAGPGREYLRSMLKRGAGFSESSGRSITSKESHLCWACIDKMNLFGFMADQNGETSKISESPESVSLADASAEKATQGSDTDLEVEGECFLTICPH